MDTNVILKNIDCNALYEWRKVLLDVIHGHPMDNGTAERMIDSFTASLNAANESGDFDLASAEAKDKLNPIRWAKYICEWDDGLVITFSCQVNTRTREVVSMEESNYNPNDDAAVVNEFIELDGKCYDFIQLDECGEPLGLEFWSSDEDVTKFSLFCLYKLSWLRSHNFSEEQYETELSKIEHEEYGNRDDHRRSDVISEFSDVGFGGEIWACFDEFCDSELQDENYIHQLCDNDTDLFANYIRIREEKYDV